MVDVDSVNGIKDIEAGCTFPARKQPSQSDAVNDGLLRKNES